MQFSQLQCEQSESELGQLAQQQILLVRSCLDLLSQYGTVASLYPASYLNAHRSVCYRRWAQQMLDNLSAEWWVGTYDNVCSVLCARVLYNICRTESTIFAAYWQSDWVLGGCLKDGRNLWVADWLMCLLCIMTWWCFCDMLVIRYIIVGCLWLVIGWLNFIDYLRKIAEICGL
jgi:hypothetical protein